MLTNTNLTVYHKDFDPDKRIEKWIRNSYEVWFHGGVGSSTNKGYENSNDVQIRIPYDCNENLNILDFGIGDILVEENIKKDIITQQDLSEYQVYNITSIVNNVSGFNKHIHISGK